MNEKERFVALNLFSSPYSLRVYNEFLVYVAYDGDERLFEGSILSFAGIDAWIVTVAHFFVEQETRCRHRYLLNACKFRANLT